MATMTAILLERRKDIAVMKGLGASNQLVMELLLTEVASLGLLGGLAGFALGGVLAQGVAQHLFSVTMGLTWWTLPAVCLASMLVAVFSAVVPAWSVRGVDPAAVLKGE
jgi:putative ABC transport system permease protein